MAASGAHRAGGRVRESLRGYHNVCLHRAGPVATGCGKRQTMQCKYHGWTYNLRGELLRAPDMEANENFSPGDFHLQPVQVAAWGPLVFANLDLKAQPLSHFLEDLPARCAPFAAESMRYVTSKEWRIDCNWKVYVDNYQNNSNYRRREDEKTRRREDEDSRPLDDHLHDQSRLVYCS